jgi:hypothetical protein
MFSGICCCVTGVIVLKFQRNIIPSFLMDSTLVLLDTEEKVSVNLM